MKRELVLVEDHLLVGRALVRLLSPHFLVSWTSDPIAARRVVTQAHVLVCAAHFGDHTTALLQAAPSVRRVVYGEGATDFAELCEAAVLEPERVLAALR